MKNVKILLTISIICSFFLGLVLTQQFPQIFDFIKGVSSGVQHSIDPPKITKDFEVVNKKEIIKQIETNSFVVSVENTTDTSIKDLIKDRDATNQHKNAALYGVIINNKTQLRYFTRNGYEINNGIVKKYLLPK